MSTLTKLRQWINRDNGHHFQVGNRSIGAVEAVGLLLFVGALALWQLHSKIGISSIWAYGVGAVGLLLVFLGGLRSDNDAGA